MPPLPAAAIISPIQVKKLQARKGNNMPLGAHMSIKGGVQHSILRAQSIGCTAVQLFTGNARGWASKPIPDSDAAQFRELAMDFGPEAVVAHDGYLINLASPKPDIHKKSMISMADEINRCDQLAIPYLVMHPGAGLDLPREKAIKKIAHSFDRLFAKNPKSDVMVLLEITAGQGSTIGSTFEELQAIIDQVKESDRLGVCFDTCHAFAAGYDISNKKGWLKTFREFNKIIGLDKLKVFHVNDSKKELGSRRDRHEHIGKGELGLEAFRLLMNDRRFKKIPKTLETPKGEDLKEDIENLNLLRSLIGKKSLD